MITYNFTLLKSNAANIFIASAQQLVELKYVLADRRNLLVPGSSPLKLLI